MTKQKMHYRLYTSVINIFNRHAINLVQFSREIGKLSDPILKYFIQDRISDEQLEKFGSP